MPVAIVCIGGRVCMHCITPTPTPLPVNIWPPMGGWCAALCPPFSCSRPQVDVLQCVAMDVAVHRLVCAHAACCLINRMLPLQQTHCFYQFAQKPAVLYRWSIASLSCRHWHNKQAVQKPCKPCIQQQLCAPRHLVAASCQHLSLDHPEHRPRQILESADATALPNRRQTMGTLHPCRLYPIHPHSTPKTHQQATSATKPCRGAAQGG